MSRTIWGPPREQPPLPPLPNTIGGPRPFPPQARPRVEVVEPFTDPTWSEPGTFGRRIQLFQSPDPGQLVYPDAENVATGVFRNTKFPGPPRPVGVQLFRAPELEASGDNSDFRARLTYGCSGVVNSLDLDWLQGAQFPLVCDTLEISAVTYAPTALAAYSRIPSGSVTLGAVVGLTAAPVSRVPTFTTQIVEVPGGPGSFTFRIPDLARVVWPMVFFRAPSAATMANMRITMLMNPAFAYQFVTLTDELNQRGFVIPGGTTRVRISNTHATDPAEVALCYGIGL